MNSKLQTILVHLPAYRDPELVPTIKNALENAKRPASSSEDGQLKKSMMS